MRLLSRVGRLFPRSETVEVVTTTVRFDAAPDAVWKNMMFYEEVPGRPGWLLRAFLPAPVRTQGDKTRVGALVECNYEDGYLEKRITAAEPPSFVRFDVVVQRLGIEDCISMTGGSYDMRADGAGGTDVVLVTRYRGHLRPRWLWRPLEHFLAHRLHRYILEGMRVRLVRAAPVRTGAPVPEQGAG